MGTETSKGTKVFALSGKVTVPDWSKSPWARRCGKMVFDIGGGIPDNKMYKAVQIGGPSGGCIPQQHLDIPVDYESLKTVGAMMGSGGLVVMDEDTCMVDLAKFFMEFIQSESCGKCIPCREGTRRMLEILKAISASATRAATGRHGPIQGVTAVEATGGDDRRRACADWGRRRRVPVLSTLRWFRDEYEAHLYRPQVPGRRLLGAGHLPDRPRGLPRLHGLREGNARRRRSSAPKKNPHYIDPDK